MIVSPAHAKRILRALRENISRYEAQFGPIREAPEPSPVPNVGSAVNHACYRITLGFYARADCHSYCV